MSLEGDPGERELRRLKVYTDVTIERDRQDYKWGYKHDDEHGIDHFVVVLTKHLGRLASMALDVNRFGMDRIRQQLIILAAVCFAAAEAIDRKSGS